TAASATITNTGSTVNGGDGGETAFFTTSTASNAILIANAGSGGGNGGAIFLLDDSAGGTARVQVFGNGNLDVSYHNAPGVTIGSLEGSGSVFLGAQNLTVGSNNLSTALSALMQDGGQNGGPDRAVTNIGTGTLRLASGETYPGGTIVNAGRAMAKHVTGS